MRKLILTILLLMPFMVSATEIFTEDFESPVVTGTPPYFSSPTTYSGSPNPFTRWLRSDTGFGSGSAGVVITNGNQQLTLRYTNSGYSTDEGEVGTIDIDSAIYTVSFDIIPRVLLGNTGMNYKVEFVAYPDGYDRQNFSTDPDLYEELAEVTGTTTTNRHITIEYTTDATTNAAASGMDLGIRVYGATSQASIDNITVDYVPYPRSVVRSGTSGLRVGTKLVAIVPPPEE